MFTFFYKRFFILFLLLLLTVMVVVTPVQAANYIITAAFPNLYTARDAFQLNSDAYAHPDGYLRLTRDSGNLWGSAFNKNKIVMPENFAFTSYFQFQILRSTTRADGFVFVIQGSTATAGGTGQDLGFTGINPGFGIEFDTYQNDVYGDPNNNHIAIITNGSANHNGGMSPVSINTGTFDLADGAVKHAWIEYDGTNVHVRLGNSNDRSASTEYLNQAFDISSLFTSQEMYFGFTASTGGESEEHRILNCYFNNDATPTIDLSTNTYTSGPSTITVSALPATLPANDTSVVTANAKDEIGQNIAGLTLDFTTTSGTLNPTSAITDANGNASVNLTGPGAVGASTVRATHETGAYDETDVNWTQMTPVFSNLSSPSIILSSSPTAISGYITCGPYIPTGVVNITLNGVTLAANIDPATGYFSANFTTNTLSLLNSPYTINYAFGGDANFLAAAGTSTLTVTGTSSASGTAAGASPTQAPEIIVQTPPRIIITAMNVHNTVAQVGQPVTITANVANRGDLSGVYSAELAINGEIEQVKTGTLSGHAAIPVEFTVYKDTPGTYTVDINGQQSNFTVSGSNNIDISPANLTLIGIIICAIGVVVTAFLLVRRRHT